MKFLSKLFGKKVKESVKGSSITESAKAHVETPELDEIRKVLEKLPIVSREIVPKSYHPNMPNFGNLYNHDMNWLSAACSVQRINGMKYSTPHENLMGHSRDGGTETYYYVYRIGEDAYRWVEMVDYID